MKQQNKWIAFALLFAALILVNFIAAYIPIQLDLTSGGVYTLSPGSKSMLSKIEEPVTLKFYYSSSVRDLPIYFKNFANRIHQLLLQYQRASGGMVHVQLIDPRPDTKEETDAVAAGLSPQPLPDGQQVFLGLVVVHADTEEAIPFFTPQRETLLEYDISSTIARAQQVTKPKIGIISGLNVVSEFSSLSFRQQQLMARNNLPDDWVFVRELRNFYDIVSIDPTKPAGEAALPDNLSLLMVIHPQAISDALKFQIDQFLLSGKPVIIAVDPYCRIQFAQQQQNTTGMNMMNQGPTMSNLPRLFEKWGIEYDPAIIVGDFKFPTKVPTPPGQQGSSGGASLYPTWIGTRKFSEESPITSQLKIMLFVDAGHLNLREGTGLSYTPLSWSSPECGTLRSRELAMRPPNMLFESIERSPRPLTFASLIQGEFSTAFPDGPPSGEGNEPKPADKGKDSDAAARDSSLLKKSTTPGTLVVITDVDFLADNFSVQEVNLFGSRAIQPINDNLNFISNLVESLTGSTDLLTLRGKEHSFREFELINDMQREAEKHFRHEEQQIDRRLAEVRRELSQIMEKSRSQSQLMASPELRKAVQRLRKQEAEFVSRRREIRKNLREDIETLDRTLSLINLLTLPLLIALAGVAFFVHRSKRQKKNPNVE